MARRPPLIAIVGRPNVGKSTLFNRIVGRRAAIVHDQPGLTRDRNYGETEWAGRAFRIVDTGGWEPEDLPTSSVSEQVREQAALAIDEADLTIVLADGRDPDNPVDRDVVELLRRRGRPFLLAVNRCDNPERDLDAAAFYSFGVEEVFPVSALHGRGAADLLDRALELLPNAPEATDADREDIVRVAVVGRPNVGKSTLINRILGDERLVASPMPGTTRDAIDTRVKREGRDYVLIDTAGIRRRGSIETGAERLSVTAATLSMERSDIALLLMDGAEGVTEQDAHIAGYAAEAGCGLIVVVNKWDAVEKDETTAGAMAKKIRDDLAFIAYAPIIMVSALTGQRVAKLFEHIDRVAEQHGRRIPTGELNRVLERAVARNPPAVRKNRPLRIKYAAQVATHPPLFAVFCNDAGLMHFSYRRYLINQLRREYGFEGTPVRLSLRSTKRDEPRD